MKKSLFSLFVLFTTYASYAQITSNSFAARADFSSFGTGDSHLSTGDIDGDGKKDVAIVNQTSGRINIFRNTSVAGTISFASRLDYAIGGNPTEVYLEDLDNDGKLDVISTTGPNGQVVVYRNLSSGSGILLSSQQTFSITGYVSAIGVADLDNDGKKDIVVADYSTSPSYTVLRNISSSGNIMFSTGSAVSIPAAYTRPTTLTLSDLDTDGKADLIIFNEGTSAAVLANTTTGNTISFSSTVIPLYIVTSSTHKGDVADVDGDGLLDVAVSSYYGNKTSLFRNTSTPGAISFATEVDFNAVGNIQRSVLKDLDADGKPELIQSAGTGSASRLSIFKNLAVKDTLTAGSFDAKVDFATRDWPNGIITEDLDQDGKKDIILTHFASAFISVFRGNQTLATGLVAYYPFNGNAGDSSGNRLHGTNPINVSSTTNRFGEAGKAYAFNGTNAKVEIPGGVMQFNSYTYSAWFRVDNMPANNGIYTMLSIGNIGATGDQFIALANNYSTPTITGISAISYGSPPTSPTPPNDPNTGVLPSVGIWYHVVSVRDSIANKILLYVNGVKQADEILVRPVAGYSAPVLGYIGCRVSLSQFFRGALDDIRIYNTALNAADVLALYTSEMVPKYYSKATGNLNQLATWGTNTDGSGIAPLSFDSNNVVYQVRNNTNPIMGGSFKIKGANSTLILGDGTNAFNLAVNASDTLSCDSIYINNSITLTASGRVISTKVGAGTAATAQYIGTASPQYIAGGTYTNLLLNGNGADKSLTGNTTVTNNMVMIATVNTASYNFTLGSNTSNTGTLTRNAGTINGRFTRWFANTTNSGTTGLFPVGTSTKYAPFNIEFTTAPSVGGMVTAEFINTAPGNTGLPLTDFSNGFIFIDKAAIDGYWKVTSSINTGTFSATETANNFTGVNLYSDLRLMRRNTGGSWVVNGTHIINTGSNSSVVISRSGLSSLQGEYGVGGDQSGNPLPVKLVTFEGNSIGNDVKLTWATALELNNKGFEIERSLNGKQFESVGFVKGNGNTNTVNYSYTDINAFAGSGEAGNLYYKLKQVDNNNGVEYSNTIKVDLHKPIAKSFTVYPNPSIDFITIEGAEGLVFIYDLTGNKILATDSDQAINISKLSNGIYFIRCGEQVNKFIKN